MKACTFEELVRVHNRCKPSIYKPKLYEWDWVGTEYRKNYKKLIKAHKERNVENYRKAVQLENKMTAIQNIMYERLSGKLSRRREKHISINTAMINKNDKRYIRDKWHRSFQKLERIT